MNAFDKLVAKTSNGDTKKSKTPIATLTGKEAKTLQEIHDLNRQIKTEQAILEGKKEELTPTADRLRTALCVRDGTLHSSIKLDNDTIAMTFIRTHAYHKMNANECGDRLQATVGDKFNLYFSRQRAVSIKLEAMTDAEVDKLCKALEKILGDKLPDVLSTEDIIKPNENWTHDVIFDQGIRLLSEQLNRDGLVVQNKATFR